MRRGKEESRDYRVNFKFTEACNKAIKRYSCDSEGFTAGSFTHTTSVLQCLNNHVDNGTYVCVSLCIYISIATCTYVCVLCNVTCKACVCAM